MTWTAADSSLGAWLRRVPAYLYLVDLVPGKRVLEVGCGTGFGAQFLASHGAGRVVAVDRSARRVSEARSRYRQSNLEFRCEEPGSIEMEDASFDCVFVPEGVDLLRRRSVLGELRRLLVADGHLVVCGASADRRGARGGASFYEFRERLERMFSPVRMIAQTPFVGFSLVEYGDEASALGVQVDTSLGELEAGEPEACDYVAVCGGPAGSRIRDWCLVQVPEGASAAVVEAIGAKAELSAAASIEEADSLVLRELRLRLEKTIEERARAHAQAQELREQVEELRRTAAEPASAPAPAPEHEHEPEHEPEHESTSELIALAMTAHREVVRSLEIAVEEGQAYAEELRAELEETASRAAALDSARVTADDRAARLEAELRTWRTRASLAEGQLLRGASAPTTVVAPHPVVIDSARAEELSELQSDLARVRASRESAAPPERDVRVRLGRLEGEVDRGRDLLRYIEEGLAELEKATARESADRAPSAWAAHRDQQLRELSSEIGIKDAEITILHVGVSALRARLKELIAEVRLASTAMRGRTAAEMQDVMDHLSARLHAFEERE
ncbi:MAG TPA: methyltransferase domain-containing protein [Kofleriaceae bacterium]|nr:methyltransferase domain-containing protein [Kofleriaceae bacterium]